MWLIYTIIGVACGILLDMWGGFWLMIGIGAAHSVGGSPITITLGFWVCFWLTFGFTAVVGSAITAIKVNELLNEASK